MENSNGVKLQISNITTSNGVIIIALDNNEIILQRMESLLRFKLLKFPQLPQFGKICSPCFVKERAYFAVDINMILDIHLDYIFTEDRHVLEINFGNEDTPDSKIMGVELHKLDEQKYFLANDYIAWAISKDGTKAI